MFKEISLDSKTDKRGMKRSLVWRVGINDAPYQTTLRVNNKIYYCPYFMRWKHMFTRCYSPQWLKKNPTYVGCTVDPEWHSFMAFKQWMLSKDWKDKQLDKDLLSLDKKVYSPNTCLFVSRQVNSLFNERANDRGNLPVGIYARKGKYEVGISYGNAKRTWVGSYNTVPEAIDAYINAKRIAANKVIRAEPDQLVKEAVRKYLEYFTDKLLLLKAGY